MVDVKNDVRIYECSDWNVEGTCKFYPKVVSILTMDKLGGGYIKLVFFVGSA